jgi:hypothetical protein
MRDRYPMLDIAALIFADASRIFSCLRPRKGTLVRNNN